MKLKDIKGDLGAQIKYDITNEINELMFGEIKKIAPELLPRDHFWFGNMENFKRFLKGNPIGFQTHGYGADTAPQRYYKIPYIHFGYCKDENYKPSATSLDIDTETMHIEIDLVSEYKGWWDAVYSIKAKDNIMDKLSEKYDKDIVKGDEVPHYDKLGKEIKIGDIVCYSTTYSNSVDVGTIEKFNDCTMVVDGSQVEYDAQVLVVTDCVKEEKGKYVHI